MSAKRLGSRAILGRLFFQLESGGLAWIDRLSYFYPTDQESEEHAWLGVAPTMREWKGGRVAHGLRDQGIVIPNKEFEATIEVRVPELRRDKTGQVMWRIDDLARRANTFGATLLTDLIEHGHERLCYDGQFFFDVDHVEGDSGVQSNMIEISLGALPVPTHGGPQAPSVDEMAHVILKSIETMHGFKDDQGEPLNEGAQQYIVMVGTNLMGVAVNAVTTNQLSEGQGNPLLGLTAQNGVGISVVGNPRLPWTDTLATFRADQGDNVAPFIRQEEVPLQVKAQAEDSPEEFNNNRHLYGVNYSGNFGYGFWQHAVRTVMVV